MVGAWGLQVGVGVTSMQLCVVKDLGWGVGVGVVLGLGWVMMMLRITGSVDVFFRDDIHAALPNQTI